MNFSYCRSLFCRTRYTMKSQRMEDLTCTTKSTYSNIVFICFEIQPARSRSIKIRIGLEIIFLTPSNIFMPTIFVDSCTICIRSWTKWNNDLPIHNCPHVVCDSPGLFIINIPNIVAILPQSIYYLLCWSITCSFPNARKCRLNLCSSSSNSGNTIRNSHTCIIMIMTRKYKIMFFS